MLSIAILKSSRAITRGLVFTAAFLLCANAARADDSRSIRFFGEALAKLAPDVDPTEAAAVAATAHNTARRLAREWRVVPPAEFQNFLIQIGKRQFGYCFHWARGIGTELKALHLKTLVLHWGAAEPGTLSESNCLVVTARGQPFRDGYVIDAWRGAGRLYWWPVKKDTYAWKEDLRETAWLNDYGPSNKSHRVPARAAKSATDHPRSSETHTSAPRGVGSLE